MERYKSAYCYFGHPRAEKKLIKQTKWHDWGENKKHLNAE